MHPVRLRQLLEILPEDCHYFNVLTSTLHDGSGLHESEKIAVADNDPAFAWIVARSFYDLDIPLPSAISERTIVRAYHYLYGQSDPVMREVMALQHPRNKIRKWLLDCHLISIDETIPKIARMLNLSEPVVRYYENLFFCVRDRLYDETFMVQLVFPETRRVELDDMYHNTESTYNVLLRTAYTKGLQLARELVGIKSNHLKNMDCAQSAKELESLIMSTALHQARLGYVTARFSPALHHGRGILQASKAGGQEEASNDSMMGLTAISMTQSVMDTVKKMQAPEIKARMAAQRASDESRIRDKKKTDI